MNAVDTADRIGLPFYVGWLAGHGWLVTLLLCCVVTPGLPIVIARIFESRWLPLRPRRQFLSFFPGDIFLGAMTASLLVLAQKLPAESRWYNSGLWHVFVQLVTIMVAIVLTRSELKSKMYPRRAIFSPTKLYHNGVLYAVYGYLVVTTLTAVLFGSSWTFFFVLKLVVGLAWGLVWLWLVQKENTLAQKQPAKIRLKALNAHIDNWHPIWR